MIFNSFTHRQPKLCGSCNWLDFEFLRERMKINKIRPKLHFSTKTVSNKMKRKEIGSS